MEPDFDQMDYDNAMQDFKVEYMFFDENGNEDYDDVTFSAMDADEAERKFELRFANDIVSIQAL